MKASFAKFPTHKRQGNNKDHNMYINEYRNMRVDSRDIKVANIASDNGRCWWIYKFIMAYPFRIEH